MAASWPTGFDSFAVHPALMSTAKTHGDYHEDIEDILTAVETELGLNPSGTSSTVAARLALVDVVRRRDTRAAATYGTGDTILQPNVIAENVGGITGPVVGVYTMPFTASYAISCWVSGVSFTTGVSAVMITAGGFVHAVPILNGTVARVGGSIVARVAAAATVSVELRNGTGGSMVGLLVSLEIARVG